MSISADVIAAAQASQRKWKVPASVSLAQWALESGWGKHMPPGSNNPFGIKAVGNQAFVIARTSEFNKTAQRWYKIDARFRKFASMEEAFDAHAKLLATSRYYVRARQHLDDPNAFADALTGVYATAPGYGALLRKVMADHNLYQYDVGA